MKLINKYTKLSILTILLVSLVSCNEFLSELPDNRAEIDSPEKISALVTGAYPDGNYMLIGELMSDNAVSKNTTNGVINQRLHEDMFNWRTSNDDNQDTPIGYWSSCYEAISQANQALVSIEELKGEFNLNSQKGEALLARAYAHFMLVNFWAKHYDPNTASTDLGIPYVDEPENVLLKEYKRNTVQEVYDRIEKDMLEGISLVTARENNPKFHFSKESGNAFATRFYTFKGEWAKVIEHASKVISDPRNELRDQIELRTLSYGEQTARYNSTLERSNLLVGAPLSWWARTFASINFGLPSGSQIFNTNNPFGKPWGYQVFGGSRFANRPKFDEFFNVTNQSAGTGFGYAPVVYFAKDEVLLNRAEAYAMLDDFTNANQDLTDYLSLKTRGFDPATDILTTADITTTFPVVADELTPPYLMTDTQTSYVKAILDFKQKEFYHEGMRWFDVRRFNIAITRDFIDGESTTEITLPKNDNRRQLQIPESAQKVGLTPNPR
ncbi:RagB/SusD family nutrient uptake outer membrane protein [Tenacibaculum agarivorans]|uniref:RagB/SusD family nutrient uptake outer membrane protein n=1 Tax=Tenacibaculum agarivorans TaxID=1908389 RepID=UPI00094BC050|nr:RagB/SusD family nutrient uptake outer membrane protein [Tenacibaculum agarivorans]